MSLASPHRLPSGHHTGWVPDSDDGRDYLFHERNEMLGEAVGAIGGIAPTQLPPIWNQLNIGSCTAHGSLRAFLTEGIRQGLSIPMLSRLQEYWNSRAVEGTTSSDSGAQVRDAVKVLYTNGCAPEVLWPYNTANFAVQPPGQAVAAARQYMSVEYQRVVIGVPGAPMRTALKNGLAVVFGFQVPSFFEDGSWDPASEKPLPLPDGDTQYIGGHCVAATYYNFSGKFVSGPAISTSVKPYFTCDNSWDTTWGMAGRFNILSDWFDPARGLASDFWVIQKVD